MIAQPTPIRIAELIGKEVGFVAIPDVRDAVPQKVLPSVGSVMHELGTCKPCAWFWKQQGCKNGRECLHCHLCSSTEVRHRKKQRALAKRISFRPPPGLSICSEPDSPGSMNTEQSSRSSLGSPDPLDLMDPMPLPERTVLLKSLHAMGPNRRRDGSFERGEGYKEKGEPIGEVRDEFIAVLRRALRRVPVILSPILSLPGEFAPLVAAPVPRVVEGLLPGDAPKEMLWLWDRTGTRAAKSDLSADLMELMVEQ
ncbi:unnamed protein product, partial [Cladocopium goreaui]